MSTLEIYLTLPKSQKEIKVSADFSCDDAVLDGAFFLSGREIKSFSSSKKVNDYIHKLFNKLMEECYSYYAELAEEKAAEERRDRC